MPDVIRNANKKFLCANTPKSHIQSMKTALAACTNVYVLLLTQLQHGSTSGMSAVVMLTKQSRRASGHALLVGASISLIQVLFTCGQSISAEGGNLWRETDILIGRIPVHKQGSGGVKKGTRGRGSHAKFICEATEGRCQSVSGRFWFCRAQLAAHNGLVAHHQASQKTPASHISCTFRSGRHSAPQRHRRPWRRLRRKA